MEVGWSDELRRHWLPWIGVARATVESGSLPDLNLDVALDHNGIRGSFDDERRTPLCRSVMMAAEALYDLRRSAIDDWPHRWFGFWREYGKAYERCPSIRDFVRPEIAATY